MPQKPLKNKNKGRGGGQKKGGKRKKERGQGGKKVNKEWKQINIEKEPKAGMKSISNMERCRKDREKRITTSYKFVEAIQ